MSRFWKRWGPLICVVLGVVSFGGAVYFFLRYVAAINEFSAEGMLYSLLATWLFLALGAVLVGMGVVHGRWRRSQDPEFMRIEHGDRYQWVRRRKS